MPLASRNYFVFTELFTFGKLLIGAFNECKAHCEICRSLNLQNVEQKNCIKNALIKIRVTIVLL